MRKFIYQSYRRKILIFICILFILAINGAEIKTKIESIEKKQIEVLVDENLREGFEDVVKLPFIKLFYDTTYSEDNKNTYLTLTTDIEKIDQSRDYEIISQSPLIFMMKDAMDFNEVSIAYNKKGFLLSDSKIKTSNNDTITCDFTKVVDVVIDNGNWSDLGGEETEEIIIYCPKLDTVEGKLFKEFLVRSFNNGLNESNQKIEKKIQMFFESENVIQTEVYHKLQLLKDNVLQNAILVGFEHDLLNFYNNYNQDFVFIYPQKTILKNIYLQMNAEDETFNKNFLKEYQVLKNIHTIFNEDYYYRLGETGDFPTMKYYSNVQAGIDTFEN